MASVHLVACNVLLDTLATPRVALDFALVGSANLSDVLGNNRMGIVDVADTVG